jgi:hypothetical protein
MRLTELIYVYTVTSSMGRPPKPDNLRRDRMLPIRVSEDEWRYLRKAAEKLGMKVSEIFREGARLYINERGKDGSPKRKEKRR